MYNLKALYYNIIMQSGCFSKTHVRHTSESGIIPLLLLTALGIGSALVLLGGVTDCSAIDFGCYGLALAAGIVKVVATVLAEAAEFIYGGVASVLQWVVRNMLSIPVAPGAPGITPVVTEGWKLSLSFVNALLLLILVFIGLATILRFREYEIQRTLPRLIIVALLVNFSGILVGLVVDISNILANFFFSAVRDVSWAVPWPGASGITGSGLAQIVASSLGIFLYYIIAIFIYLAFIALMFTRTFVLWTLAILAPLAFAASILPATKGYWNRWLSTLLHWAFMPVPIGFFLYLAGYALVNSAASAFTSTAEPGSTIVAFISPFLALFLLFAGLTLTAFGGPMRSIGRFAKKAATIGAGFLAAQAIMRAAESKKLRDRADKWSSSANPRWGYDRTTGEKKTGAGAATARALGGVVGFGKRASGKPLEGVLAKGEQTAEEKAHKKAMTANDFQLRALLEDARTGAEKKGITRAMLQRRRTKQVLDADSMTGTPEERKFQQARLEDSMFGAYENSLAEGDDDTAEGLQRGLWHRDDMVRRMAALEDRRTTNNTDKYNDVTGAIDPTTGETIEGITQADYDRGVRNFKEKIFRGARTQDDFKQFQRSAIRSDEFGKLLHSEHGSAQQAAAFVSAHQQEGVRILESHKQPGTHYGEMVQKGVKLDQNNQPILINGEKQPIMEARNLGVARYEAATGGQNAGMSPKEGLERVEDVQRLTKIAKNFAKGLEGIQDKATRDAVQTEFETILEEMEDLQGKEDVMKVLAQDRQLSSVFKAIPKENEQARRDVAQALNKIKDTSQWRDIGDILQNNPELHHVAPQLADMPADQREHAAEVLGEISSPQVRANIAGRLVGNENLQRGPLENLINIRRFEQEEKEHATELQKLRDTGGSEEKIKEQEKSVKEIRDAIGREKKAIENGVQAATADAMQRATEAGEDATEARLRMREDWRQIEGALTEGSVARGQRGGRTRGDPVGGGGGGRRGGGGGTRPDRGGPGNRPVPPPWGQPIGGGAPTPEEEAQQMAEEGRIRERGAERLAERQSLAEAPSPQRGIGERAVRGLRQRANRRTDERRRREEATQRAAEEVPKVQESGRLSEIQASTDAPPSGLPSRYYELQIEVTEQQERLEALEANPTKSAEDLVSIRGLRRQIQERQEEMQRMEEENQG